MFTRYIPVLVLLLLRTMAFIDEERVAQLFVKGSQVSDGAIPWLVRYFWALCFGTALLFYWGRRIGLPQGRR
jgi:hypothetical protein